MMSLNKGKHIVEEIEGVRCTVVESKVDEQRSAFLRKLLEHNNYEVKAEADGEEGGPVTYKIGVTDLIFNPVIDVYKRRLISLTGKVVTPAYWLQQSTGETEAEVNYYSFS
jgi:hypothetical protein